MQAHELELAPCTDIANGTAIKPRPGGDFFYEQFSVKTSPVLCRRLLGWVDRRLISLTTSWPVVSLVALLVSNPCLAQVPQPRPPAPPAPLELPEFAPEPAPPFRLPPVTPVPEIRFPPLRVFVRDFVLSGNTVFSDAELGEITAPFENREISSEELQEVQHRLTLHYVNRGYINSGAVLPDQQVTDGVVRIQIVEGRLTDITVTGTKTLLPEFVSERLELGAGPPLNVNELGERIQILTQSRFINRINADLKPGDRPGEAQLTADIEEPRPYQIQFSVDNQVVPTLGDVRGVVRGWHQNLTGWGDILTTEVEVAEGLDSILGSYSRPITAQDTRIELRGEKEDTKVVNEFEFLGIESEFWSLGFNITHPFYLNPQDTLTVSAGLERRHSQTFILGSGFAFSPGVEPDGESDVTVIRLGVEFVRRSRSQVFAARSTFSFGIDAFNATVNPTGPSAEYFAWLGQFQWARRVGERGGQVLLRVDAQLTPDQLLPMEQYSVGGARSVRGYQENQIVRDYGFSGSIEYRHPVYQKNGRNVVQVAAFIDGGGAWNNDVPNPEPRTIWGPGIGLLYDPSPRLHAELYWGIGIEDISNQEDSLSNDGIHFQLVANVFD